MAALQRFSLQGRVALITGASSGIGHALALGFAEAGARVVACARRLPQLESLVDDIRAGGGEATAVQLDVREPDSISAAFDRACASQGLPGIIVNSAGIAEPKTFPEASEADLERTLDINLKGVWRVSREAAQRLIAAGQPGCMIHVASILSFGVHAGQSAYCASKGALAQLTRAMALDLMRHGIRVNAIAPGWFRTEINDFWLDSAHGQTYIRERIPARRTGQLEELVGPALLLASDAGSYINGVVLPVDGAHHAVLL